MYSIFIPGNEIPTWFSHRNEGDTVSFIVPRLDSGFKIIGIVTCAIYAWRKSSNSFYFSPHITLSNSTKMYEWIYDPYITFLSSEVEQDMNWLCYWMFDDLKDETGHFGMSWRFKDEMEEGDEVEFSIDLGFGINVKNCGIHLLSQPTDSQSDDLANIPYASSRHQRRFLKSCPRFLTLEGIKEVPISTEHCFAPPKNQEFVEWSDQREQRTSRWICQYDNIYKFLPMSEELEEGSRMINFELQSNSAYRAKVVEEIVKMDGKVFPEQESRAAFFDEELNKKDSELLYLEIDKDIVGYVMCSRPSSACAYIAVLAVKEKYRRQGHGEALMKAAIKMWNIGSVQGMSLHVDPLNTAAMSLYLKLGFQVDELIQGYYFPDRSACRMYLEQAEEDL